MINWDKELEKIFNDPLLADVTAPKKKMTSSDRLIAGFQRIVEFVEDNGRRPKRDADREERSLYNQLKSGTIYVLRSLSKDPEIAAIPHLYKMALQLRH